MGLPVEAVVLLGAALVFDFANGMQGSANIVATMVSSRVMHPRRALWLAALAEGVGPFLFGAAVAGTVGSNLIVPSAITPLALFAALLSASLWSFFTIYSGIPSSPSHALIGGLLGGSIAEGGLGVVCGEGLYLVLGGLFVSPFVGMIGGFLLTRWCYFFAYHAHPRINLTFKRGQLVVSCLLALAFGSNDAQKVMGVMMLGLVVTETRQSFTPPMWVIASAALVLAGGTLVGGRRLIRTLGTRFYKIRPVHGLAAQTAACSLILLASGIGAPVSTTQVVSSSIIGAGSADRLSKVRWGIFDRIMGAWLLTLPITGGGAALLLWLLKQGFE